MPPHAEPERLCSACRELDIEKISPPRSFAVHDNLEQLRNCKDHCFLCDRIYDELVNSIRLSPREWRHEGRQNHYQARLELRPLDRPTGLLAVRVCRAGDDNASSGGIDDNLDSSDDHELFTMMVLVEEGDEAAQKVPWIRQVGKSTCSRDTLDLARSWVSSCASGNCLGLDRPDHDETPVHQQLVAAAGFAETPNRLVEMGSNPSSLRLLEGTQVCARYVTLSYVWGTAAVPWKTTAANLSERNQGFATRSLPKTLQDAVLITHNLAFCYLWIDSCRMTWTNGEGRQLKWHQFTEMQW